MADLMSATNEVIREATDAEIVASYEAGHEGWIEVDGERCYVEGEVTMDVILAHEGDAGSVTGTTLEQIVRAAERLIVAGDYDGEAIDVRYWLELDGERVGGARHVTVAARPAPTTTEAAR